MFPSGEGVVIAVVVTMMIAPLTGLKCTYGVCECNDDADFVTHWVEMSYNINFVLRLVQKTKWWSQNGGHFY